MLGAAAVVCQVRQHCQPDRGHDHVALAIGPRLTRWPCGATHRRPGSGGHRTDGPRFDFSCHDPSGTGDTCPRDLLDKVDVDDLKEEYGVLGAFKNGPRLWTLDWAEAMVGGERDFSGLKAR